MQLPFRKILSWGGAAALTCSAGLAATVTIDFNTDPSQTQLYTEPLGQSAEWRASGGASGAANDGYLSVTDARDSQSATLVFKDLEDGLIVKNFTFECDLRMGGGNAAPADGFSLNYASPEDGVVGGRNEFAGTDTEASLPEEGTRTGLAIGFDTWQSSTIGGVQDVVGISIRVDNRLIAQIPVPLSGTNVFFPNMPNPGAQGNAYVYDPVPYRNLPPSDPNYRFSMQTGARNDVNGDGVVNSGDEIDQPPFGDPTWDLWVANLRWEKFKAEVTEQGKVRVFWKGFEVTPEGGIQTGFTPRAGRLVLAGRTGGNNQVHHVDNIVLTTVPFTSAVVQTVRGNAGGFTVEIKDQANAQLDPNSVSLTLNGASVPVSSLSKVADVSYVRHNASPLLAPGTTNTVVVTYKDNFGVSSTTTRTFTTAGFNTLPAQNAVPIGTVDTASSGFLARVTQIAVSRLPGDANTIANAERQLRAGFIAPEDKQPYPNLVQPGPGPGGTYPVTVINFNQEATHVDEFGTEVGNQTGSFRSTNPAPQDDPDKPIPGVQVAARDVSDPFAFGYNNNIAAEFTGFVELPAGFYTFGVNSDDGFRASSSRNPKDVFGVTLGSFNGGRGSSDSLFDVHVPEGGVYPIRLTWWEGGGGANVEFFYVDAITGEKILFNDDSVQGAIKVYQRQSSGARPYVASVAPEAGQLYVFPDADIVATLNDGAVAVDDASITLTLNGNPVQASVSNNGAVTTVRRVGGVANLLPAGLNTATLTYSFTEAGNPVTVENTWTFTVPQYGVIPTAYKVSENTIDIGQPGFEVTAHQIDRSGDRNQGNGDRFPGDGNRMPRPEVQLANGYINPTNDLPYPNLALPGTLPDGSHIVYGPINMNMGVSGSHPNWGTTTPNSGMFTPDEALPGLPGSNFPNMSNAGLDNYVAEFRTYLKLSAGAHLFGVNSDDGFMVNAAANPRDTLGTLLGVFNGGRGNSGSLPMASAFSAVVLEEGYYPIRILYWQGGGGVNIEFLEVDRDSGRQALVNDGTFWVTPAFGGYNGPARAYTTFSVAPTPWDNRIQQAGPGPLHFFGRTPGSVDANDQYNVSDATRPFADVAIGGVLANAAGKQVGLILNGQPVPATTTTNGDKVTVAFKPEQPLPSGSTNTAGLVYEGTTNSWRFVVQSYVTVPADQSVPVSAADPTARGLRARVVKARNNAGLPNNAARAESQLAGTLIDPNTQQPFANEATPNPNEPDGSYILPVVNWNQNMVAGGSGTQVGNFRSDDLVIPGTPQIADSPIPGISTVNPDQIAAEVTAWLELPAGYVKMGVNSDDGFRVTVATSADSNALVLGQFEGGKGASDVPFSFMVPQAGLYPVRLVWYEGGGGADLEFFSYGPNNQKIPINADVAGAIKAYYKVTVDNQKPHLTIDRSANGTITVTWTNGGTLQGSPVIAGPGVNWTNLDSDGSHTLQATDSALFLRVVK